jgi:hypothetical protein
MTTRLRDLHHPAASTIRESGTRPLNSFMSPLDVLPRAGAILPHLNLVVRLVTDAAPLPHNHNVAHLPRIG